MWGERGPTGDHGQAGDRGKDGTPGARGERGPAGAPGIVGTTGAAGNDLYEDPAINAAIAEAMGENRLRSTDRRMLIMFGLLIASLAVVFVIQERTDSRERKNTEIFRIAIIANCEEIRQNAIDFNSFIDDLVETFDASPLLPEAERNRRVDLFSSAKSDIPTCPPSLAEKD